MSMKAKRLTGLVTSLLAVGPAAAHEGIHFVGGHSLTGFEQGIAAALLLAAGVLSLRLLRRVLLQSQTDKVRSNRTGIQKPT